MTSATLDRLLGAVLALAGATGLLAIAAGGPGSAWLYVVHGVAGAVLVGAVALKLARSVPAALRAQRIARLGLGSLLAVAALTSPVAALIQAATGATVIVIGPWSLISWHAYAGIALGAILLVHLAPHRWRLLTATGHPFSAPSTAIPLILRTRRPASTRPAAGTLSRRALLEAGMLGAAGVALWSIAQIGSRFAGAPRRFTGSISVADAVPPATTFFGEATPAVDAATWRLSVATPTSTTALTLRDLAALPTRRVRAVLDCTSGWSADCMWTGASFRDVLAATAADRVNEVQVTSVTGWSTVLRAEDLDAVLLATHVADQPLPAANGAPLRLVVPDRRGLEWVKWVDRIEVR